ncbi:MAG: type II toxin-antitoxin system RelB/DinJ family antitoxin [Anaeroplasmataceae bacterium]|nr:type II toxin-antitoxin system RelB/DinJ family antitoxin [Anaeroplasmataceae bacterium]
MQESTNINIRMDKDIKNAAEKIFNELGLNMTTAINIFLRKSIQEHGIPFDVKLNIPNETTLKAIEEGETLNSTAYNNINDLKKALGV